MVHGSRTGYGPTRCCSTYASPRLARSRPYLPRLGTPSGAGTRTGVPRGPRRTHGIAGLGFDRQRDPAVVADIAHLAVLGQVSRHDLVAAGAGPYHGHLGAAVRVQGHQVSQGRGLQHGPGATGEGGHAMTLAAPAGQPPSLRPRRRQPVLPPSVRRSGSPAGPWPRLVVDRRWIRLVVPPATDGSARRFT
jgi:hypothetical protein